jgi:hypothetical protein
VLALVDRVEHVPLGTLRAHVVLSALDSRGARQHAAAAAWRLAVPFIDAGVHGEALLARVNVHLPGLDAPCLECAWTEDDYTLIAAEYPCAGQQVAATHAPASLGGLAAALQALECRKLLRGEHATLAAARQVMLDATWHQMIVTRLTRNPHCRFDHAAWSIAPLEQHVDDLAIGALFDRFPGARLRCTPQVFVTGLACLRCGTRREIPLRLSGRLRDAERICASCGGPLQPLGSELRDALARDDVPSALRHLPLAQLGFRGGDIVTLTTCDTANHIEIGGSAT